MNNRKQISTKRKSQGLFIFWALGPIILLYMILRIIPIFQTFYLSFHEWDLISKVQPWVGLDNFRGLLSDSDFLVSLKNTVIFSLGSAIPCIILALFLALAVNSKKIWGASGLQAVYFIPVIVSMVPISIIWKWIYDPSLGILNYALSLLKLSPRAWLVDPRLSMFSIILMTTWKQVGYYMVIFVMGLKNISRDFYEAAEIDGANAWQRFCKVTLPLLKPITLFVTVMATINSFMVFTQIYVMTEGSQGAPGNTVRVIVFDMYEKGFRFYQMGLASAEAVVLFVMVLGLSLLQLRLGRSHD